MFQEKYKTQNSKYFSNQNQNISGFFILYKGLYGRYTKS